MPSTMKIQPVVDVDSQTWVPIPVLARAEPAKPVLKSRLKRLFDRQLRISSVDKPIVAEAQYGTKDGGGAMVPAADFEPSSVCLAKMVQNYLEDTNEKQQQQFLRGRHRYNCFNGSSNDSSDDEFDVFGSGGFGESIGNSSSGFDACDVLKSLIPCASVAEKNLLADTAMIVEKNKNHKGKGDLRKIVAVGLSSLGYDSSICKSNGDKSSSFPAGKYEYVDVIIEGERLLVDVDFRSEFEIARSTGPYKAIMQSLPFIFVGRPDRLSQIVSIVSEAARQSLKKKGLHIGPWRKSEYVRAKWLSPYTRLSDIVSTAESESWEDENPAVTGTEDCGELELIFGEEKAPAETVLSSPLPAKDIGEDLDQPKTEAVTWQPPALKPKRTERGPKMVTGLASLLKEKP
uniref:Uncharacterized protein MANES_03G171000 n=1 Tax=Rhizophora mucronata TaxID=61149 RepID=A0A2P2K7M8_RHIMU